ncbi:MAG: hypothetical protein IPL47_12595 [Phyllobacteriaceae bacterium]|nr:hypothetical protein [Phyllobacteriaceae bacterium]
MPPPLTPPHKGEGDQLRAPQRQSVDAGSPALAGPVFPPPCGEGSGVGVLPAVVESAVTRAAALLSAANRPAILAGGGARRAEAQLRALADALGAPVVATVNARGLMHGHRLLVPASPSLVAVRRLIADADAVLALGAEFGPTDPDMYAVGGFPEIANLIRVDIDPAQLARGPSGLHLRGDAATTAAALLARIAPRGRDGAARAAATRIAALAGLSPAYRAQIALLETIRDALPGAIIAGDSTQPVYAGNLFFDHDAHWFNSATGYGALGYALPAAIGAALACPDRPVVSLIGDGGLQFCLAELGSLSDAQVPVIVLVWNNAGYREIETSMLAAGVTPVGVSPSPPDFLAVAKAYGVHAERLSSAADLAPALARARARNAPVLIDMPEGRMVGSE